MNKNQKKVFMVLNYNKHLLVLVSTITGRILFFACASLVGIPIFFTSSAVGINICVITTKIRKYKSRIKKIEKSMIN